MQVVLPIFTALLGAGAGLGFARLGKVLDRRREQLDAEAAEEAARAHWLAEKQAAKLPMFVVLPLEKGFRLENLSQHRATGISITFNDYSREKVKGLPDEPFTLDAYERVEFRLPGAKEMLEMPNMWVMCTEYAKPALVQVPDKWPFS
jgi:hypothetical protein